MSERKLPAKETNTGPQADERQRGDKRVNEAREAAMARQARPDEGSNCRAGSPDPGRSVESDGGQRE
eukprot:7247960-Alexandrium_andersonii.AAC.1